MSFKQRRLRKHQLRVFDALERALLEAMERSQIVRDYRTVSLLAEGLEDLLKARDLMGRSTKSQFKIEY